MKVGFQNAFSLQITISFLLNGKLLSLSIKSAEENRSVCEVLCAGNKIYRLFGNP